MTPRRGPSSGRQRFHSTAAHEVHGQPVQVALAERADAEDLDLRALHSHPVSTGRIPFGAWEREEGSDGVGGCGLVDDGVDVSGRPVRLAETDETASPPTTV